MPLRPSTLARSLLLVLLVLVPLLALQLQRRTNEIVRQVQESRDDTLAIMEADLSVMKRAAGDWGHWDDVDAYMRGENPNYQRKYLQTAALFDGGAAMVLLDSAGASKLAFADPALRPPAYSALIRCVQSNIHRLATVLSTVRLACRIENGQIYLGAATKISNNNATAPPSGTIAVFDPLLKREYSPRILRRLQALRQELVLLPLATVVGGQRQHDRKYVSQDEAILPLIHSEADTILALRAPVLLQMLGRSMLGDGPLLLGILMLLLALRALQMLDRRRQLLRDRLATRRISQGIRRACNDLNQLIESLGSPRSPGQRAVAAAGLPSMAEPLIGLSDPIGSPSELADPAAAASDRPFAQVVRRFHQVLASARSLALQDPLTQLPNRRHFMEQLASEAQRNRVLNQHFAILFVDVDKFKAINDSYGHVVGDAVLVHVAQRLGKVLRPCDFLARYGGDELAILLDLADASDASEASFKAAGLAMAERLSQAVQDPIVVDGHTIDVSLSIGIGLVSPQDLDLNEALRRSDLAMYEAKRSRHSRIIGPDAAVAGSSKLSYQLYGDLIHAIRSHQLMMVFQPIVDEEGGLIAAEALVRWVHPRLGPIDPTLILELAEHHRQMPLLGPELIRLAMEGFRILLVNHPQLSCALNLSASQLQDGNFSDLLLAELEEHRLPPRQLIIEITEHCLLESNATVHRNLERLRDQGIRFALDDFGTGYASLMLLRVIRPDVVKIDKSFIQALQHDPDAVHIVRLIVDLALAMGLDLIAEGIEDRQTFEQLRQLGLRQFQGFAFSLPQAVQGWSAGLKADQLPYG